MQFFDGRKEASKAQSTCAARRRTFFKNIKLFLRNARAGRMHTTLGKVAKPVHCKFGDPICMLLGLDWLFSFPSLAFSWLCVFYSSLKIQLGSYLYNLSSLNDLFIAVFQKEFVPLWWVLSLCLLWEAILAYGLQTQAVSYFYVSDNA